MKTICILFLAVVMARAENSVILKQTAAPLVITKYTAKFEEEKRDRFVSHPDRILHSVTYSNVSAKEIVALQIGLASFNSFNAFMGRLSGLSIETVKVGASGSDEWAQTPLSAFSFRKFGTGVAYVNAVRFDDGTIWRADMKEVLTELQKFEKDLKPEDLEEKKK